MGFSGFGMETKSMDSNYQLGLVMVAGASMLSGLSAALTQKTLVSKSNQRHPILFSAELAIYGILFLIINMVFNSDIKGGWLFSNWDAATLIPVTTNVS